MLSGTMLALVAHQRHGTNARLAERGALIVPPLTAARILGPGDVALGRLDVRRDLGGVESGLDALRRLESTGARVLNTADALLAMHDKLVTAQRLSQAGVPHPRTVWLPPAVTDDRVPLPVVVKPRFGSWGAHVHLCSTKRQLARCLDRVADETWFREQGALLQELVPPQGRDLRVLVAGGDVIGAIQRIAAPGEWRTNVALGGTRRPARPSEQACALALAAADALGADLAGVDLLPAGRGYVVLEVNGAVDFTDEYAAGEDVFARALDALARHAVPQAA